MDKKKRKKKIESLEKQRKRHLKKIKDYKGKNYAVMEYWEREVKDFGKEIEKEKRKLEKS
jgi:recombinational DNA repair ATPase RecF